MIQLTLIRHAESEMNKKEHLIGGRSNHTPLSPHGEEQARRLGKRLRDEGVFFNAVHTSSAVRAYETARIATGILGFPWDRVCITDSLMELHQGEWEGRHRSDAYTPEALAAINADCWNFTPPNGESQKMVEERMYAWITTKILTDTPEDSHVAMFSHGNAMKCFLRGILNSDPNMTRKIAIENTSITRLIYDRSGWHLMAINDTAHLQGMARKLPLSLRGLTPASGRGIGIEAR